VAATPLKSWGKTNLEIRFLLSLDGARPACSGLTL
jgi:hypothetical protein